MSLLARLNCGWHVSMCKCVRERDIGHGGFVCQTIYLIRLVIKGY